MNHFMLPRSHDDGPASASARYGVNAMELLINELIRLGARRCNLEAKVFGGGSVVRRFQSLDVGAMNARFVCNFLRDKSIAVVAATSRERGGGFRSCPRRAAPSFPGWGGAIPRWSRTRPCASSGWTSFPPPDR